VASLFAVAPLPVMADETNEEHQLVCEKPSSWRERSNVVDGEGDRAKNAQDGTAAADVKEASGPLCCHGPKDDSPVLCLSIQYRDNAVLFGISWRSVALQMNSVFFVFLAGIRHDLGVLAFNG